MANKTSQHKENGAARRHRALYKNANQREKNKLKRIAQSNGKKWARVYAREHGLLSWARGRGLIGNDTISN